LNCQILLAADPQGRKFTINPRRVHMYGKGESMEFMMTHPEISTAATGCSWGSWLMPSEVEESLDFVNSPPGDPLDTRPQRSCQSPVVCSRRIPASEAKGYHLIYREFDELEDRTDDPPSNDDALAWATRLRNNNLVPSAAEAKLLKATSAPVDGYYPTLAREGAPCRSGCPEAVCIERRYGPRGGRDLQLWNLQ
jgi:hypothetical protein